MFWTRNYDRFFDWREFDRAFALLDAFRRESEAPTYGTTGREAWLNAGLEDNGTEYVFHADFPGLTESDIEIFLNQDVLTLKGERTVEAPEGYSVHRRERPSMKFSRSYTLPQAVDAEKTMARVNAGVLTVTLPKLPESQPRQITVKTA